MKTGFAFADHIRAEKIKKHKFRNNDDNPMRGKILLVLLFLTIGLLAFRLINLQLVEGAYYRSLSDSNRTRRAVIHAPRGVIFDRNGKPLVYNMPGFLQIMKDKTVNLSKEEAIERIASGESTIEVASLRQYPYKDVFAHVLGYVGQISEDEMKQPEYLDYGLNDWIGKSGIEQYYEASLRGVDGQRMVEVDAVGKPIRTLGQTDPIPGNDITLTLDADLQLAASEAMKDVTRGSVVVATPKGEILALLSKPSYDPNLFTLDKSYKASTSGYTTIESILLDGEKHPLLNRAVSGVYPPGSTFKLVTAAAGLHDKTIDASYSVEDTGVLKIGEFSFSNWFFTQYGRKDIFIRILTK